MVFQRADHLRRTREERQRANVQRFDPARVDDRRTNALFLQQIGGFLGHRAHAAQAKERHPRRGTLPAVADHFGLADFEQLRLGLGFRTRARTAGITDRDRAFVVVRHRPEHVGELLLVLWAA